MATIITRLYKDAATAQAVVADLKAEEYADRNISVISGSDDLENRMAAANVSDEAASVYAPMIKDGNSLVVVKALLGQARPAIAVVNRHPSIQTDLETENAYIPTTVPPRDTKNLIMRDHPLMLTSRSQVAVNGPFARRYGDFAFPLLSKGTRSISAYQGTKRFGDFIMPLLSKKERKISVYQGTKRFGAFLVPLLSKSNGERKNSVFQGNVFFANFLAPHLIRR